MSSLLSLRPIVPIVIAATATTAETGFYFSSVHSIRYCPRPLLSVYTVFHRNSLIIIAFGSGVDNAHCLYYSVNKHILFI